MALRASPCYRPCVLLDTIDGPVYGDPVAGETVTHTWPHSGTFTVELTATDSTGRSATTTVDVNVNNEQPILELVPDCPTNADGDPVPIPAACRGPVARQRPAGCRACSGTSACST